MENGVTTIELDEGLNITQSALLFAMIAAKSNFKPSDVPRLREQILRLAEFDKPPEGSA